MRRVVRAAARPLLGRRVQIDLHVGVRETRPCRCRALPSRRRPSAPIVALTRDEHLAHARQPRHRGRGLVDLRRADRARHVVAVDRDDAAFDDDVGASARARRPPPRRRAECRRAAPSSRRRDTSRRCRCGGSRAPARACARWCPCPRRRAVDGDDQSLHHLRHSTVHTARFSHPVRAASVQGSAFGVPVPRPFVIRSIIYALDDSSPPRAVLIIVIVLVASCYVGAPYVRAASLIVRAADIGGPRRSVRQRLPDSRSTCSRRTRCRRATATCRRSSICRPGASPHGPAHSRHPSMGIEEPRLTALAAISPRSGVAVMAMALPDLQRYPDHARAHRRHRGRGGMDGGAAATCAPTAASASSASASPADCRSSRPDATVHPRQGRVRRVVRRPRRSAARDALSGDGRGAAGRRVSTPSAARLRRRRDSYGLADRGVVPPSRSRPLRDGVETFLLASQLTLVRHEPGATRRSRRRARWRRRCPSRRAPTCPTSTTATSASSARCSCRISTARRRRSGAVAGARPAAGGAGLPAARRRRHGDSRRAEIACCSADYLRRKGVRTHACC